MKSDIIYIIGTYNPIVVNGNTALDIPWIATFILFVIMLCLVCKAIYYIFKK